MRETRDLDIKWPQWHTFAVGKAGGGGHEGSLHPGREEDVVEASQDGLLEEMGSQTRV